MKRYALVFFAAIFLPSLLLGWLALRTAGEQRIVIERQTADLHQGETDLVAANARARLEETQRAFSDVVRSLAADHTAAALAENFGPLLDASWSHGGVAFAVSPKGALAYPGNDPTDGSARERQFVADHSAFLRNRAAAEIYQPPPVVQGRSSKTSKSIPQAAIDKLVPRSKMATRQVAPYNAYQIEENATSNVTPETSDFQTAVEGAMQGILARFVEDQLQVLIWTRLNPKENWIFGVMLGPAELAAIVRGALPADPGNDTLLAILNDRGRPVACSPDGFEANWKRPFVATEIGEILPHWEVALYLANPGALTASAQLVTLTLILLIALALGAILAGGYFVASGTRRQLDLAQKKTDFVSNVSHELKTPLTSIRMFAELLAEGRVREPEKQSRYLRIIAGESERLTRLVNNVLDFARSETKRRTADKRPADAHALIAHIWESESLRLREAGFAAGWDAAPGPYPVVCDPDAFAQVLVNILSNAEKYSPDRREITLRTRMEDGRLVVETLDRGCGVPRGLEERIFTAFFRADDSLASGVQGSGLGLTLSRRIARDHGGDVTARSRDGGGSVFTFTIPLANERTPPCQ